MSIPAVEVSAAEGSEEPELEVSDDPSTAVKLDTSRVPILLTISQVHNSLQPAETAHITVLLVLLCCYSKIGHLVT